MGLVNKRLGELDFIRGIAIVLVLLNHQYLSALTTTIGWVGVDLFFVLSGFLVSGLLFKEYQRNGYIKPFQFLIRRGFKIYPVYYLTYPLYLVLLQQQGPIQWGNVLYDLLFLQNYTSGWGYAYTASWSLAVEEHFYILLSLSLFYVFHKSYHNINLKRVQQGIIAIMLLCLLVRVSTQLYFPLDAARSRTLTHLRIDSLLAGVLIAFRFYFYPDQLRRWFQKYRVILLVLSILCCAWVPFVDPKKSIFTVTLGFSLLYVSFGILLLFILLTKDVYKKIQKAIGSIPARIISRIGQYSYSIYVIHLLVNALIARLFQYGHLPYNHYLVFAICFCGSILTGALLSATIEQYFLNIRDKYFGYNPKSLTPDKSNPA